MLVRPDLCGLRGARDRFSDALCHRARCSSVTSDCSVKSGSDTLLTSISTDFPSLSTMSMLSMQCVFLFSLSIAPDDHGSNSLNSALPISSIRQLQALSVAITSFALVLMLNCWDIFGLTLCSDDDDGPHLVGLLVHLLDHLDQCVTGGHDWENIPDTVIVWRSAWPSRCDIPGTAPYRNGTVLRCVPQFIPRTFTLLEQRSWC